ncbi:MAG TPA: MlaD family protein, partial [Mycobacterium sp.]|nr:MlaD family protein [Mycobacterium sp.]
MEPRPGERHVHPAWWTLVLVIVLAALVMLTAGFYSGSFTRHVPVTLTSNRAGLIMETGGKVMMNGVQVGQVGSIAGAGSPV